jgi:excinuclease ABC subunit C
MTQAAQDKHFEKAAKIRDQITAINKTELTQLATDTEIIDRDVIAHYSFGEQTFICLLQIREGKIINQENFILKNNQNNAEEIGSSFIKNYYSDTTSFPQEILISENPPERKLLELWLKGLSQHPLRIICPQQGKKNQLLRLAAKNAKIYAESKLTRLELSGKKDQDVLVELQQHLKLPTVPRRVECYDISHLGGTETVSSMVVFEQGQPQPAEYRKFKIKTLPTGEIDDYKALAETLTRRLEKLSTTEDSFKKHPDLIMIDGGKGQLSIILPILWRLNLQIPIIALAKKEEEIFFPQTKFPLKLPPRSEALYLLQRIRDEAHRFAITYQKKRRKSVLIKSKLDQIPGVGIKLKKKLLSQYGSLTGIKSAPLAELADLVGEKLARKILENI